jgi:general secretion pathway protein C
VRNRLVFISAFLALVLFSWLFASAKILAADDFYSRGQGAGLRLIGTAVGSNVARNVAIIEVQAAGNQTACREGDRLGQMRIEKIGAGYVVIQTGSGEIKLTMGSGGGVSGLPSTSQAAHIDRQDVAAAVSDYARLAQEIRVRPRFESGRPSGFLIYNIAPDSIFERMGLENGDVISAVNGRPFETTMPVAEFYTALSEGGVLALAVMRAETKQTLHLAIQ